VRGAADGLLSVRKRRRRRRKIDGNVGGKVVTIATLQHHAATCVCLFFTCYSAESPFRVLKSSFYLKQGDVELV